MAHFVDSPSELFHSMAWAMSIKSCSGQYARNHDEGTIIFPSDSVYYRCNKAECYCLATTGTKFHLGRVLAVGKDFTKTATIPGVVKLIINPVYPLSRFKIDQANYPISPQSTAIKLFLSENKFHHVGQDQIESLEREIHYDHRYEGPNVNLGRHPAIYKTRFVVRNTYDIQTRSTNVLQLHPPSRGELPRLQ